MSDETNLPELTIALSGGAESTRQRATEFLAQACEGRADPAFADEDQAHDVLVTFESYNAGDEPEVVPDDSGPILVSWPLASRTPTVDIAREHARSIVDQLLSADDAGDAGEAPPDEGDAPAEDDGVRGPDESAGVAEGGDEGSSHTGPTAGPPPEDPAIEEDPEAALPDAPSVADQPASGPAAEDLEKDFEDDIVYSDDSIAADDVLEFVLQFHSAPSRETVEITVDEAAAYRIKLTNLSAERGVTASPVNLVADLEDGRRFAPSASALVRLPVGTHRIGAFIGGARGNGVQETFPIDLRIRLTKA